MDAVLPASANPLASSHPPLGATLDGPPVLQTSCHHPDVVRNWSFCQSCLPLIQAIFSAGLDQWTLPSPFPDYVYVPALMHRSQLGMV